jgi:endonuclease-3
MANTQATAILQILKQTLTLPNWTKSRPDPFETLITTIISQNTADTNTAKACAQLQQRIPITPKALAEAPTALIEQAIRPAGLNKAKAQTIKRVAKGVLEKYEGSLQPVLALPLEQARAALMEFAGIGPKTADVVLLFSAGQPTVPVDTHVNRVSKRLGFAPAQGNYETVHQSLQALFDPKDYLAVHLLLIEHGRKTCKAQRPLCSQCPVNTYCPSNGLEQTPKTHNC